jgi:PAS domain S-box-containing protein
MIRAEPHLNSPLLDTLDTGVIVLDGMEQVVVWNLWIEAASGITAAAARGLRMEELFPGASLDRLRRAVADSLESGATSLITHVLHPLVLPLRTPAGQELWHNISVRAAGDEAAALCVIQVFDVTAATRRERVLRERQNARYHAVVDSAPDVIVTLDDTGLIQLANPAASQGFGYAPGELVGRPVDVLFADQSEWDEMWAGLLSGQGRQRPVQIVARRKDGSPSHLEVSASRWISDGRSYITAILRDVNERHAAEHALRLLNETLEERVTTALAERKRLADMVEATDALIRL